MRPINMDGLEEVQICHKLNPIKSFGSKSPKTNTQLGGSTCCRAYSHDYDFLPERRRIFQSTTMRIKSMIDNRRITLM